MKQRLTITDYARHRKCSQPNISKLIRRGRITPGPDGLIDVEEADTILDARAKRARKPTSKVTIPPETITSPASADAMTFAEAERRKAVADALSRELKLARELGQVVAVADATAEKEAFATEARARFLNLPTKLTQRLLGCSDRAKFISTIEAEIREALTSAGSGS